MLKVNRAFSADILALRRFLGRWPRLRVECCAVGATQYESRNVAQGAIGNAGAPTIAPRGTEGGSSAAKLKEVIPRQRLALRPARAEPLQGETGDFAGIFQVEFVFDMCPVGFYRLRAEI